MAATLTVIADRLRKIRSTLQYSETEVSAATGLPEARLLAIEAGSGKPSGDEILILASLYDCDFRSLLDDQQPAPGEQTDILFRRYGQEFSTIDRRSIQEFIYLCQVEDSLENLLARQKIPFQPKVTGNFFKGQGEQLAKSLRLALDYAPNAAPRDIYADFRRLGIHIFRRRLSNSEISGLYIEDPIAGNCVLINYNEDLYRQRFSAAHEVAHALLDSSSGVMITYHHESRKYKKEDFLEIRANSFASHYLMPLTMLEKIDSSNHDSIAHWAQQFRVSVPALLKALKDANLITHEQAKQFKANRPAPVEKIDPEAPENLTESQRQRRLALLERGLSDHFVNLCFEAHYKELISTGRLIEALRIDPSDLAEVALLYGRTIRHGL